MKSRRQAGFAGTALAALAKSQILAAAGTALFRNQLGQDWVMTSTVKANAPSTRRADAADTDAASLLRVG